MYVICIPRFLTQFVYFDAKTFPFLGDTLPEDIHPVKPHIMARYKWHVDYVDNSGCMANSYLISQHYFKWATKLFPTSGYDCSKELHSVIFM